MFSITPKSHQLILRAGVFLGLLLMLLPSSALSQEIARLYSKEDLVEGRTKKAPRWVEADVGRIFEDGDSVRVGKQGRAGVLFADGVLVRLSNRAAMTFRPKKGEPPGTVEVKSGKGHFMSRKPKAYPKISTPTVSAAIRGTEFVIEAGEDKSIITVMSGAVEASNDSAATAAI